MLAPTSEAAQAKWEALGSPERGGHRGLVGSAAEVIGQLRAYEAAGPATAMVFFPDRDAESIDLFAERVMPGFLNG